MKKNYLALSALLTLCVAFAGCSNDENSDTNAPVELRLTSGLEVQTRATQGTSLAEGEKVYAWVDDAIANAQEYKARELTATAVGSFTYTPMYFPQTGNSVSIYAMHGKFDSSFSEGDNFPGADGVAFTVEADQSGMGAAYTNSDLLYATRQNVARTNGNVELTFYHMLSKMDIAIVREVGVPELATDNAVTITDVVTDGTFNPTKTDISDRTARQTMITAGSTKKNMFVSQRICSGFEAGNVDYNEAIVVPQDMVGKEIEFKLADGSTLSYTIPAFTETPGKAIFESGKRYIYHITLKQTGLVVTANIKDWDNGNTYKGDATMR